MCSLSREIAFELVKEQEQDRKKAGSVLMPYSTECCVANGTVP
jgi:hypothetical protein